MWKTSVAKDAQRIIFDLNNTILKIPGKVKNGPVEDCQRKMTFVFFIKCWLNNIYKKPLFRWYRILVDINVDKSIFRSVLQYLTKKDVFKLVWKVKIIKASAGFWLTDL